ncbi:Reticuline oxidase-like protein [Hibiscus syriacus]|uniref:Reticuline oxidase-like protein n=1 Tax=Hibiscus syriacus TaxID=106335 RepID=A0A6A3D1J3_HIBSY|nr:berberine bridge enzyme-like 21 [Hibiscus syriacus]KAE8734567.1 Reticuline oxidase-like protein [Hibiscus syriacus]
MRSLWLLLLLVSHVFFNLRLSFAASDPINQSLLQCLSQSIPADEASSIIYSNSNPSYSSILRAYIRNARFNTSSTPKPLILITPSEESHVSAAVTCAQRLGFRLRIRSGGHDFEGLSYVSDEPFFVLDMFNLRSVTLDMADESAWVDAGATLGELYYNIWKNSKVHGFPAGVCPTVGIGGHISGAGYGTLIRKYGLSVDHVVDAKLVDVNGRILNRKNMGEDLFWAIRGGGAASFGVVLSYKINLVPVPETVTVFRVERLLAENATDITLKWQSVAPTTDDNLFLRMLVQPVTRNKKKTVRITVIAFYLGDSDSLVSLLNNDFPELGIAKENCNETSWIDSVLWWANFDLGTQPKTLLDRDLNDANFLKRKSDYVQTPIPRNGLESLWEKLMELGKVGLVFNPYGGQMNRIKSDESPFPHRAGNLFKIQYSVNWEQPGDEEDKNFTTQAKILHEFMTPFVSRNPRSAYLNYRDIEVGRTKKWSYEEGKVYGESYFNGNYERLVDVKTAVDPNNFFRNEQSIPPRSR